jgi:hypothetical protein
MGSTVLSIALYALLASAAPLSQVEDGVSTLDRHEGLRPKVLGRPHLLGLDGLLSEKSGEIRKGSRTGSGAGSDLRGEKGMSGLSTPSSPPSNDNPPTGDESSSSTGGLSPAPGSLPAGAVPDPSPASGGKAPNPPAPAPSNAKPNPDSVSSPDTASPLAEAAPPSPDGDSSGADASTPDVSGPQPGSGRSFQAAAFIPFETNI